QRDEDLRRVRDDGAETCFPQRTCLGAQLVHRRVEEGGVLHPASLRPKAQPGRMEVSFPNGCHARLLHFCSRTCVIGKRNDGVVLIVIPGRTNGFPFSLRCVAARMTPWRVRFLPAFLSVSTIV